MMPVGRDPETPDVKPKTRKVTMTEADIKLVEAFRELHFSPEIES